MRKVVELGRSYCRTSISPSDDKALYFSQYIVLARPKKGCMTLAKNHPQATLNPLKRSFPSSICVGAERGGSYQGGPWGLGQWGRGLFRGHC